MEIELLPRPYGCLMVPLQIVTLGPAHARIRLQWEIRSDGKLQ